ncbi:hypothetical protein Q7P37_002171 [Cladosporium fusiforme]
MAATASNAFSSASPPTETPPTASSDPFIDNSTRRSNHGGFVALMTAIQQVSTQPHHCSPSLLALPPRLQLHESHELPPATPRPPTCFSSMSPSHFFRALAMATARPVLTRLQAVPPPPSPTARLRSSMAAHNHISRRGQCTHITMQRLHGDNICQMCGKLPEFGWLYVCRQDWLIAHQDAVATKAKNATVVTDECSSFDFMANHAASINMSPSSVQQIRAGLYTIDQVKTLVAQKQHLIDTIRYLESLPTSSERTAASHNTATFPSLFIPDIVASVGAKATSSASRQNQPVVAQSLQQTSSKNTAPTSTAQKQPSTSAESCNYMVCHACRPFLQDRLYVNIASVLNDSQPPVTEDEARTFPVMQARNLLNIGLRKPPPSTGLSPRRLQRSQSIDIALMPRVDSNYDYDTPLDWTTSSTSSSSYDDDLGDLRVPDPYPCPGAGVCPVYSRNSGCAYDTQSFEDGQRALAHGFTGDPVPTPEHTTPDRPLVRLRRVGRSVSNSSTQSTISLPTPTTLPLMPDTPTTPGFADELANKLPTHKPGKAATVCGVLSPSMDFSAVRLSVGTDLSGKDSHDSFGSEVEVDGGVALTEEAIGTGLPDIRTE